MNPVPAPLPIRPHRLVVPILSGLLVMAMTGSTVASPSAECSLQGRYLIFFPAEAAEPAGSAAQAAGMAKRAKLLLDGIGEGWAHDHTQLLITSHVDAQEQRQARKDLGSDRAAMVRTELIKRGVDPLFIWTRSDGMQGAMLEDAKGSEAQNRFVSVVAPAARTGCDGQPTE